jgi:hypothetical protein
MDMAKKDILSSIHWMLIQAYRWVLPMSIVFLVIILPKWFTQGPQWDSWVADWLARLSFTIFFAIDHRQNAAFLEDPGSVIVKRQGQSKVDRSTSGKVVNAFNFVVSTLTKIGVVALWTQLMLINFVPLLEPWRRTAVIIHISAYIWVKCLITVKRSNTFITLRNGAHSFTLDQNHSQCKSALMT